MAFAAVVLVSLTAVAQDTGQPFDHAALARTVLERHIEPRYTRLAAATRQLSDALDQYCARPGISLPKRVNAAFDAVVKAWGNIEHVNFGPITVDNRLERFLFFPDRRGLGARQVARALATSDPAVTDAASLATRSVALQGLGALDIVLFTRGEAERSTPEQRLHRCRYAHAIAVNLANISRAVLEDWTKADGYRRQWLNPGPENATFVKPSETTMTLAKSFNQGLERVRDERLGASMGLVRNKAKMPPVLDKSNRSLTLVAADIEGLLELYELGGMHAAIAPADLTNDTDGVASKARIVTSELRSAVGIVSKLVGRPRPFDDIETKRRLIVVGFPLKNARELAAEVLSLRAGLALGFNSSDGD
jgi:predicted lipoprotein